jgi:circadian clock protein KaiB
MTAPEDSTLAQFENEIAALEEVTYKLTLFVSGASDLSARAIGNARRLCETHLPGRYELSVVDVNADPAALLSSRVVAVPTLVKSWPLPKRMLVGDLSHTEKVISALDLPAPSEIPKASE